MVLVEVHICSEGTFCLHLQGLRVSKANSQQEISGKQRALLAACLMLATCLAYPFTSTVEAYVLKNVCDLLPDYIALYPRI
jgi:hypothetical protein